MQSYHYQRHSEDQQHKKKNLDLSSKSQGKLIFSNLFYSLRLGINATVREYPSL